MSAVETHHLRKAYGRALVVDGLDLAVAEGQVFGFLGRNGAGKTTTLRMLLGLARPTSGTASVLGHDVVRERTAVARAVGYLPDVPAFHDWMRAPDVLDFVGRCHGLDAATRRERTGALLDMAGLAGVTTRVGGFSRGMRQRLGIAQALVNAPRLLVLDEPTSALDPLGRHDVLTMIETLASRTTVVFSTHILADVERVCDHVAIVERGRLVAQAPTRELLQRHAGLSRLHLAVGDPRATGTVDALRRELVDEPWLRSLHNSGASGARDSGDCARRPDRADTSDDAAPDHAADPADPTWLLQVTDADAAALRIPDLVARHGLALRRLDTSAVSLEDVFLDLVGAEGGRP